MDYILVPISEAISIPVPSRLTEDEQTAILAKYMASLDPYVLEAECRDLLKAFEEGRTVPAEEVLADLAKLAANEPAGGGETHER